MSRNSQKCDKCNRSGVILEKYREWSKNPNDNIKGYFNESFVPLVNHEGNVYCLDCKDGLNEDLVSFWKNMIF